MCVSKGNKEEGKCVSSRERKERERLKLLSKARRKEDVCVCVEGNENAQLVTLLLLLLLLLRKFLLVTTLLLMLLLEGSKRLPPLPSLQLPGCLLPPLPLPLLLAF